MSVKNSLTVLVAAAMAGVPLLAYASPAHETLGSDGFIQFVPDESLVEPVRPVYPGQIGTPGPLSIDVVPDFDFGQQLITQETMTYWAVAQPFGTWGGYVYDDNGDRIVIGQVRDGFASAINMPDPSAPGGYVTVYCGPMPSQPIGPSQTLLAQNPRLCEGNYLIETDSAGNPLVDGNGDYILMVNWIDQYQRIWVHSTDGNGDYLYGPLHAQITDRRGAQDGWNLAVRQDGEFTGGIEDPNQPGTYTPVELTGTSITLHGLNSAHGDIGRGRRLNVERASHATDSMGVRAGVAVFDTNITLIPHHISAPLFWSMGGLTDAADVAAHVASQEGLIRGAGTHVIDFGGIDDGSGIDGPVNTTSHRNHNSGRSTGVSITVPGNTMHNTLYTTTFTWSLANTPMNRPTFP